MNNRSIEAAAHNQPDVCEEGRSVDHPEADALVHVQLTCGLAYHRIMCPLAVAPYAKYTDRDQRLLLATDAELTRSSTGR
jgi:hypothetical protein